MINVNKKSFVRLITAKRLRDSQYHTALRWAIGAFAAV